MKRKSANGHRLRALNNRRAEQKRTASKLVLSRDAHDLVGQYAYSILNHDIHELRIAAHNLVDEQCIDSRTFHATVAELRVRQQRDAETRAKNNSPRPAPPK